MRVPEELCRYNGLVTIYNRIVIPGPHFQAVRVPRRDVSDDVHFFSVELCGLQFVDEPLQFGGWVSAVQQ